MGRWRRRSPSAATPTLAAPRVLRQLGVALRGVRLSELASDPSRQAPAQVRQLAQAWGRHDELPNEAAPIDTTTIGAWDIDRFPLHSGDRGSLRGLSGSDTMATRTKAGSRGGR